MAIPSCLVDTNILLRVARRSDPQHKLVDTALAKLALAGTGLYYTHQNIAELWNAMTRPVARNGFGLTIAEAEREVRVIETGMSLLSDSEAVYQEWRRIIVQYGVSGVQVHDARLVAAMRVHGVTPHTHAERGGFQPLQRNYSSASELCIEWKPLFENRRGVGRPCSRYGCVGITDGKFPTLTSQKARRSDGAPRRFQASLRDAVSGLGLCTRR